MRSVDVRRISLLIAGVVAIVFIGSLFAITRLSTSSPLEVQVDVTTPIAVLPTSTRQAAITICEPDDEASSCLPGELDPGQDLADPGNGAAQPAVSKDARPPHQARYVNDGRDDTSWVSNSADSWIKIDLGQVTTINMVSLEIGNVDTSDDNDLGSFVISAALSDVYADGDSSNDDQEYAPVFHSAQAGFSGTVSHTAMINIFFSAVEARFIKITFEKEGAAIEEVGVFMVESSVLAEQSTGTPQDNLPGTPLTPTPTIWFVTRTPTSAPDRPTDDAPRPSNTPVVVPTQTRPPDTPTVQPTQTQPPADTPVNTPPPPDTPTVPPADTATSAPVPIELPTEVPPSNVEPTATLCWPPGHCR